MKLEGRLIRYFQYYAEILIYVGVDRIYNVPSDLRLLSSVEIANTSGDHEIYLKISNNVDL